MTDDPTRIYTDLDGVELYVSDSPREPEYQILHVQDVVEGTRVAAYLPRRVMAALSLALSAGPDAVLRDVAPLLQQCDREDMSPEVSHRYLTTREIRMKLGLPSLCGNIRSELGGARCSLDEHSGDIWHVDQQRMIRWRTLLNGHLDVRGWSPDEMEVGPVDDMASMTEDEEVARTAAVLDRHGASAFLDAPGCREFLKEHGLLGPIPAGIMRRVVTLRQTRGAAS